VKLEFELLYIFWTYDPLHANEQLLSLYHQFNKPNICQCLGNALKLWDLI